MVSDTLCPEMCIAGERGWGFIGGEGLGSGGCCWNFGTELQKADTSQKSKNLPKWTGGGTKHGMRVAEDVKHLIGGAPRESQYPKSPRPPDA